TLTGSPALGRQGFVAVRLLDGRVLIAGGSAPGLTAEAEIYDPATATWAATGSMATARDNPSAALLPNGSVLVAGGYVNLGGGVAKSCEIYDPATGQWQATGSMAFARSGAAAADGFTLPFTNGGKLLAAGGTAGGGPNTQSSAELYDPTSGTW